MYKRILKYLLMSLFFVVLALLTLPLPSVVSNSTDDFAKEAPIAVVPNEQNKGERCKSNTIYSSTSDEEIHEKEGYAFIVDDYCADLQKRLVEAIGSGNLTEVKDLLWRGANPETSDLSKFQSIWPLFVVPKDSVQVAKLLLDSGADVNREYCCCASCRSPLVDAVSRNDVEMVRLLLQRGANVNYRPTFSDQPYRIADVALDNPNQEILSLLDNACGLNVLCRAELRYKRFVGWIASTHSG